jgi:myo-inositol-1(or 4)-monophosphatase
MSVSPTPRLSQSLLSTGFSSKFRKHPRTYLAWFKAFEMRSHAVRRVGSTALCMAYVAAGRFDGFYERDLWPWDIAAGILLVEEAGGRVTDFHGAPVALSAGRLVASNGHIHAEMLRLLRHSGRAPA